MTEQIDEKEFVEGAHEEVPPDPIAKTLLASFFVVLLLTILTQTLALYNSGTLSDALSDYISEEKILRDLTLTIFELEKAGRIQKEIVKNHEVLAARQEYSLAVGNAAEILNELKAVKDPQIAETRQTLKAILDDLKTRDILIQEAIKNRSSRHALSLVEATPMRDLANDRIRQMLRDSRSKLEVVRESMRRQSSTLDISLIVIACSMVISALLLAFVWKRLVELH